MCGAIPPLPQYAYMAWYPVNKSTGTTLPFQSWIIFLYFIK